MKRAIIYYSLTENTASAAKILANKISADIYNITLVKPLSKGNISRILQGGGMTTFGLCPKISGEPKDVSMYDEIILGTPIWASKAAAPINTLLKSEDVRNKITYVFTLSGGGDNEKCIKALSKKLPNLKMNIALCDRSYKLAEENDSKIEELSEEILKNN